MLILSSYYFDQDLLVKTVFASYYLKLSLLMLLKTFYFDQDLLVKTVFASYYLKLSLLMLLKIFLIFAKFQPHVSQRHVSYL